MAMHFFIGTTNANKIREIGAILSATGCTFAPTDPIDPEETEPDFEGNAILKARAYARHAGGLTIAEDSGLIVPALGGLPGPWSARFSDHGRIDPARGIVSDFTPSERARAERDARNNELVLRLMHGIEQPRRAAAFKVVLAVARPDGEIIFKGVGESHGWIAEEARGTNGFGYDPIFVGGDTFGKTYAELDAMRKNLRSHRRRVLQEFTAWLAGEVRRNERRTITVDGNDGTGKTTLVESLRARGYEVRDRGTATKMTDDDGLTPDPNEFVLILDAPVELCRARLAMAGRNLDEQYHTVKDLAHYRAKFLEVAKRLGASIIDASGSPADVLAAALRELERNGLRPKKS